MITSLKQFFHPQVIEAFEGLSDPERTVQMPLVEGRAAGKFQLERSLFLSEGVHANDCTANFTFIMPEGVCFELRLMTKLVYVDDGDDVVFGFVSHSQWEEFPQVLQHPVGSDRRWVLVKYAMFRRNRGMVFMSNEVYALTRTIRKDTLDLH